MYTGVLTEAEVILSFAGQYLRRAKTWSKRVAEFACSLESCAKGRETKQMCTGTDTDCLKDVSAFCVTGRPLYDLSRTGCSYWPI